MQVRLAYGHTGLEVTLPSEANIRTLSYKDAPPLANPAGILADLIADPIQTPPLAKLCEGRRSACILICDITRPVPNELILSSILETLEAGGIADDDIVILIATGMHRGNSADEIREMVGSRIADRYCIENHDGHDQSAHTYCGESPRGVPIWIDSRYVNADLKITTGLIEPHLMAGFSGGRKLVCPGIAALDTIKVWHGPKFLEHPNADCGILDGNPVHEENTWIAKHVGVDFIVNVVMDELRRPLKFVAGDMEAAFLEGVGFVREVVTDTVPEPVDIVVTCSAGYPLDTTFYQSVKGMTGAMPIVKEGGTIILAASMSEGIGSEEFQSLFQDNANVEQFMQKLLGDDYFVMDQWQLEKMAHVLRKSKVVAVTDGLDADTLKDLYVDSAPTVESALQDALATHGTDATIAVIPKGPYVLAQVE